MRKTILLSLVMVFLAVSASMPAAAQSRVEIAVPGYEAPDGVLDRVIFASTSENDDKFDFPCIDGDFDHPYARAAVVDRGGGRQLGASAVVSNEIEFKPGMKVLDLELVDSCIYDGVEYFVYEGFQGYF
jgi:hypothetical protein